MGQLSTIRKAAGTPREVSKRHGFATRDQNSSIGTTYELKRPKGDFITSVTRADSRTGSFAGKQRGVGRHQGRDENSSPGSKRVRTPSLREINGKFAGQGQGVKVFHPIGGKRGNVHTKGLFRATKSSAVVGVNKSFEDSKLMMPLVEIPQVNRVGRRLEVVEVVEKAVVPTDKVTRGFAALTRSTNAGVKRQATDGFFRQQAARGVGMSSQGNARTMAIGQHNARVRAKGFEAGNRINRGQLSSPPKLRYLSSYGTA